MISEPLTSFSLRHVCEEGRKASKRARERERERREEARERERESGRKRRPFNGTKYPALKVPRVHDGSFDG